ncbi:Uncharacterized protein HZ326_20572, partial [Fusarium oxysporum f. sp. albedinis]
MKSGRWFLGRMQREIDWGLLLYLTDKAALCSAGAKEVDTRMNQSLSHQKK